MRLSVGGELAFPDEETAVTQALNGRHVVAYEQHGAATGTYIAHFAETLFLETRVAYGEHFVYEQNLAFEICCDCESQAQIHAAGVALDRRVDEFLDLGEGNDFIELTQDFRALHAQDRAIQKNIFPPAEFLM